MKRILYLISLPFIYGLSVLPFSVLYAISDLVFFIIYYVVGYRKKVVKMNLANSFPEKSESEREGIEVRFYRHFVDNMVETLKALTISSSTLSKRARFINPELLQEYYAKNQSLIIASGHYANWEWAGIQLGLVSQQPAAAVYKPLKNKNFDKLTLHMRSRLGLTMVPSKQVLRHMMKYKRQPHIVLMLSDQTPSPTYAYWTEFLNQETPFFMGMEKIGEKLNQKLLFIYYTKIKRGHYELEIIPFPENKPGEKPKGITQKYAEMLEDLIRTKPEYWLWSHRRWKHKKPNSSNISEKFEV